MKLFKYCVIFWPKLSTELFMTLPHIFQYCSTYSSMLTYAGHCLTTSLVSSPELIAYLKRLIIVVRRVQSWVWNFLLSWIWLVLVDQANSSSYAIPSSAYCFALLGIYAAWTKMSTFAPLASSSLEDISTRRCQLSPTTTLTFKALDVQFEALEIQYAMFPPSKKRGLMAAGPRVSHRSTIPKTRNRLVEPVLIEPVLLPPPQPGAVVLNKWMVVANS